MGLRSQTPIGVDLGARHVRLVQLRRGGEGDRVHAFGARSLSEPASLLSRDHLDHAGEAITRLLREQPFKGRACVAAVPWPFVEVKNLRLPEMPAEQLMEAARWEAAETMGLDLATHHLQFFNAGRVRQGDDVRFELIALACPVSKLEKLAELMTGAGLRPSAFDIDAAALRRCFAPYRPDRDDSEARVLLHVQQTHSIVTVVRNGAIVFLKALELGERALDEAVAQRLNLTPTDASLARHRLDDTSSEEAARLFGDQHRQHTRQALLDAMKGVANTLARELGLCLRYTSVTFRGPRSQTGVLVADPSLSGVLIEAIREHASCELHPADLKPLGVDDAMTELAPGPAWATALGLAKRSTSSTTKSRALAARGAA